MLPVKVSTFIELFSSWARTQSDIEAVALVGSYAREAAVEDSDVDLVILTADPDRFLHDRSWIAVFGKVARYQNEDYGRVTSVRVFYGNALEVEFGFTTPAWAKSPIDEGTKRVVLGGIKVLHDPQGSIARMVGEIESGAT